MAKKATETIEVSEVKENTGVVIFEEKAKNLGLPAIPKAFHIGGIEVSVEKIDKKVKETLKIKLTDEKDKATYERLKKLNAELVKTRTTTAKFRNDIAKPVNAWLKDLKANIQDDIATALKPAEEHCIEQMKIYEDWEEAEKVKEENRIKELVQKRRELLQGVGGDMNVASFSWTFKHNGTLLENEDLETLADTEFDTIYQELVKTDQEAKDKEAKEKAEGEAAKNLVTSTRKQMLTLMGYAIMNEVFTKNGHSINDHQIATADEAEWMQLMTAHNTPKEETSPFKPSFGGSVPTSTPAQPTAPAPSFNPFGSASVTPQAVETAGAGTIAEIAKEFTKEDALQVLFAKSRSVDFKLKQTTIRVFPTTDTEFCTEGVEIVFDGEFTNGLSFIIYKNN